MLLYGRPAVVGHKIQPLGKQIHRKFMTAARDSLDVVKQKKKMIMNCLEGLDCVLLQRLKITPSEIFASCIIGSTV